MKKLHTLVIGSGAAGLCAAVRLHERAGNILEIYTEGLRMGTSINTGSDKQTYYKLGMYGTEPDSPVLEAVQKLKPELRTLVTLHYVDGYSIQEMAEDLGIPENTVKTRMRSARRQLGRTILLERGAE